MKRSKKWKEVKTLVKKNAAYSLDASVDLLPKLSTTSFDSSIDISIKISHKSLQDVRGIMQLPHSVGRKIVVVVIASPDKHQEALDAGADHVGGLDLIEKIEKEKWTDFDVCIATPDMMRHLGKVGAILGKKGLMPKPRAGTVTLEVGFAIKNAKAGQVEYKPDKGGVIHLVVGKVSSKRENLRENILHSYKTIARGKPANAKGDYIKTIYLSPTMGPSVKLNIRALATL